MLLAAGGPSVHGHLFALLGPCADASARAVLSQAVHSLTVQQFNGADQAGTGAAVALVAAWMAEIDMGTDKTLLVAKKDHDLAGDR